MKAPAVFFHPGYIDFVCDALFHLRCAKAAEQPYEINRYARASISAICLSIECFANALMSYPEISRQLSDELDKLNALAKIDASMKLAGIAYQIDASDHRTQQIKELIKVRNQFVHTKIARFKTEVGMPEDTGTDWSLPMTIEADQHKELRIPKNAVFWNADSAEKALSSALKFYNHCFAKIRNQNQEILMTLLTRIEIADKVTIARSTYSDFDAELRRAKKDGLDVKCLLELCGLDEMADS